MPGMRAPAGDGFSFPFVFPAAGSYRFFVQLKVRGVDETAAFDVEVPAE